MKKVTVLLSSYNHAEYIEECIQSILDQTFCDYEIMIVDDASTDNSWQIIASYVEKYPEKIQAFRARTNTCCQAFAEELKKVKTPYLAIAHSDDKWMPDKLEKQVAYLDAHPEVAACFTQVEVIDEEGKPLADKQHVYYDIFNQPNRSRNEWLRYFFEYGNCLCHPSLLIRTEAYEKYGLLTNGLSGIPDFVQWIRLCRHAEIWIYPEKLSCFRVRKNEENTSGDAPEKHYRNIVEQYLTLGEYVDLSDGKQLMQVFPETQKYLVNGEMIPAFAYARMLKEIGGSPAQALYADQLIYHLLQSVKDREKLKELYGYTNRDFVKEKQERDIFGSIPAQSFLHTYLYLDTGEGFSDGGAIQKKAYVTHTQQFQMEFIFKPEKEISALRFDPDCVFLRRYRGMRAEVNGRPVECTPIGAESRDGEDWFFTPDSQYAISIEPKEKIKTVRIVGYTSLISTEEFGRWMQNQFDAKDKRLQEEREKLQFHLQHERELEHELEKLTQAIRKNPVRMAARILLRRV